MGVLYQGLSLPEDGSKADSRSVLLHFKKLKKKIIVDRKFYESTIIYVFRLKECQMYVFN
jgi:hypothetical protein